jgi:hypothetical protein
MRRQLAAASFGLVLVSCSYVGRDGAPETAEPFATATPQSATARVTPTPTVRPVASIAAASATNIASTGGFVAPDEALEHLFDCGILGRVSAYFRVPDGNDIWDHFPEMGRSPEIKGKSGLFVALYDGEVSGLFTGQPGVSRGPVTEVLCVVDPEEGPIIYSNVSRQGMQLPSDAYIVPPNEWLLPTPPN